MVRLITHNLLACHAKTCTSNNFPLLLNQVEIALREAEFNPDFVKGFMPKIEWNALVDAARQVLFSFLDGMGCLFILFLCGLVGRYEFAVRTT
jgi:hypothetical protein